MGSLLPCRASHNGVPFAQVIYLVHYLLHFASIYGLRKTKSVVECTYGWHLGRDTILSLWYYRQSEPFCDFVILNNLCYDFVLPSFAHVWFPGVLGLLQS